MSYPARFHVFSRRTLRGRRWFFNMRGANGEILVQSEGYKHRSAVYQTMAVIRRTAPTASVVDHG